MSARCVLLGIFEGNPPALRRETWCGRRPDETQKRPLWMSEWVFNDASHAALNRLQGGLPVVCKKCVAAIKKALDNGAKP